MVVSSKLDASKFIYTHTHVHIFQVVDKIHGMKNTNQDVPTEWIRSKCLRDYITLYHLSNNISLMNNDSYNFQQF